MKRMFARVQSERSLCTLFAVMKVRTDAELI